MQKYGISFMLLFVMSGNIMGMQTLTKLYCNKKYFTPINRSFNNKYSIGLTSKTNEIDTKKLFIIRELFIEIKQLKLQKERSENNPIDVLDEKIINRHYEIRMYQELIQKNEGNLRRYLDDF